MKKKRHINQTIRKELQPKDKIIPRTLLDFNRIPDEKELLEMRIWSANYKKNNKKASRREIRLATQSYFHCRKID